MKKNSTTKSGIAYAILAAGILTLGTSAAVAGEVDGKGNPIPGGVKGKSACSYSGQQDDPIEDAGIFKGDRVQSWGQLPKAVRDFLTSVGSNPGNACNPRKSGD